MYVCVCVCVCAPSSVARPTCLEIRCRCRRHHLCACCVCVRSNVFIIICMHKARARASVCVYVSVCHLRWTYHRCCRRCHGCLPPCTKYIVFHNACQVSEHHILLYDIILDSCAPHLLAKIAHSACQISMKYSCVCVLCVCV